MKYYKNKTILEENIISENNNIENCVFSNCKFDALGVMYGTRRIENCIFVNCSFLTTDRMEIYNYYFKNCKFDDVRIKSRKLEDIIFEDCEFFSCDFNFVFMKDVNFENSKFHGYMNFENVIMNNCILPPEEKVRSGLILEEPMTGWKKCRGGVLVKLEIPKGAIIYSTSNCKYRTNHAKVIDIIGSDRAFSHYKYFSYYIGDEFNIKNFNLNPSVECGTGIHFFRSLEEAKRLLI